MTALRHDAVVAKPHARQQYSGTSLRFPYARALKPAIGKLCGHPATRGGGSRERLLVNFFYAPPVGHAIEALHYCLGHHLAGPEREVSVVLNPASAVPGPPRLLPDQRPTANGAPGPDGGRRHRARIRPPPAASARAPRAGAGRGEAAFQPIQGGESR